jgi:hypothetical protein
LDGSKRPSRFKIRARKNPATAMFFELASVKTYLDCLYDVAGILLFLFAGKQLQETVKTRTASVIIEIESRWSSTVLENSRIKYQDLIREIESENDLTKNIRSETQQEFYDLIRTYRLSRYFRGRIAAKLEDLRNSNESDDHSRYHEIMALAGFFEYIGFMVKQKYLSARDINSFFGHSCTGYYDDIALHIEDIRKMDARIAKSGGRADSAGLAYENFSSLVLELKQS